MPASGSAFWMTEEKHLQRPGFSEGAEHLHSGSTTVRSVKVECIKSFQFLRKSHPDGAGLVLHGCMYFSSKTKGGGSVSHLTQASQQHLLNVPDRDTQTLHLVHILVLAGISLYPSGTEHRGSSALGYCFCRHKNFSVWNIYLLIYCLMPTYGIPRLWFPDFLSLSGNPVVIYAAGPWPGSRAGLSVPM